MYYLPFSQWADDATLYHAINELTQQTAGNTHAQREYDPAERQLDIWCTDPAWYA